MHSCPDCGQACYCHGDIDDSEVETVEYSSEHCVCDCAEAGWREADEQDDAPEPGPDGVILSYCAMCDCLHETDDHRRPKHNG